MPVESSHFLFFPKQTPFLILIIIIIIFLEYRSFFIVFYPFMHYAYSTFASAHRTYRCSKWVHASCHHRRSLRYEEPFLQCRGGSSALWCGYFLMYKVRSAVLSGNNCCNVHKEKKKFCVPGNRTGSFFLRIWLPMSPSVLTFLDSRGCSKHNSLDKDIFI